MELTRHFTATVYIVHGGATALHEHKRHGIYIPPGGHIDRSELPHEAGLREVREETGLEATLLPDSSPTLDSDVNQLPQPRYHLLYDINVHDGTVGHQHIDLIYYATVPHRDINPAPGEADATSWEWYTPSELRRQDVNQDVSKLGAEAIQEAEDQ